MREPVETELRPLDEVHSRLRFTFTLLAILTAVILASLGTRLLSIERIDYVDLGTMLFFAIAAFVLTLAQIGCIRHIRTSVRPRLTCLVYKDEVTGIFNRRYLQDRVDEEISRAVRHGRHFALIYIDLDGFKGVNDRHGHDAGDAVLRQVALCLQGNMRREDVLGRVGGDEFLVIAPDTTQENARVFAGRLRDGMSQETFKTPAGQVLESPSFTAGIACFPEDGDTRDALISKADRDMYSRKRPATPRG